MAKANHYRGGRQRCVLNEDDRELFYNLVSNGYGLIRTAKCLGISTPTLSRIKKEDPYIKSLWVSAKENLMRLRIEGKVVLKFAPKLKSPGS